jgi:hypothetical protein
MNKVLYVFLIILGILFYWFQIRPAQIRKVCGELALLYAQNYESSEYEHVYQGCLHEKGLE